MTQRGGNHKINLLSTSMYLEIFRKRENFQILNIKKKLFK